MLYVALVVILALLEYVVFTALVGKARGTHSVDAPAVTGNEKFERMFRAHQNTLEQLIVFLPAIYLCAHYAHALSAAGIGLLFVIGRFLYFRAYVNEPSSRVVGMVMTMGANALLLLGALGGVIRSLL